MIQKKEIDSGTGLTGDVYQETMLNTEIFIRRSFIKGFSTGASALWVRMSWT